MKNDRASALAIVGGALAFVVTMALHPVGGDLDRIRAIAGVIVGTHALAIVSLVIAVTGFLGLTARLRDDALATAAMVTFAFGAVAAMCAGVLNGLALPAFAHHHAQTAGPMLETVRAIVGFNHALNASFARVFMVATAAAVVLWSIAIWRTRLFPRWAAAAGLLAGAAAVPMVLTGAVGVHVHDFALFVFAFAAWALLIGVMLWRAGGSPQ